MTLILEKYLDEMTEHEQAEVETFAAFVLARRKLKDPLLLTGDISPEEMLQLVANANTFDWLADSNQDIYSVTDGEAATWPT